jgi:hypothetical protein
MHHTPLVSEESIPPKIGQGNIRKKFRYGPITLPAANVTNFSTKLTGETGSRYGFDVFPAVCNDCFVLGGRAYLTYEDGREAGAPDGIFIHHLSSRNVGKQSPLMGCTSGTKIPLFPAMFLGAGEESTSTEDSLFTAKDNKVETGHYISPTDKFFMMSELMNYKPHEQTLYYAMEAEYTPGKRTNALDTQMLLVNIGDCDSVAFVPDTPLYSKTGTWVSPVDGYVTLMAGHLHDGGKSVTFNLNGKEVCHSEATYGLGRMDHMDMDDKSPNDGKAVEILSKMSSCESTIPIKKGDQIAMVANYDLKAHPLRLSTTGIPITVMAVGALNIAAAPGAVLQ